MKLNEILESPFEIVEKDNESEVDGEHILARVRGIGFRVNAASRNKRFYSHELWTKAIERNSTRLADRMILGYLGHGTDNSDEGIEHAAFVLTKMEINPNESTKESDGIVEYLVLGTPAGQSLNAMLRAGVRLGLSSRATGTSTGKDRSGNEMLSPETYNLHGFDIVQNTGVAGAIPNLVESKQEGAVAPHQGVSPMEEVTIKKDHYEQLVSAKASLEAKLETAVSAASEKDAKFEAEMKIVVEQNDAARVAAGKDLEQFEALGSLEQIKEILEILEAYTTIGTADEFKESKEQVELFSDIGTADETNTLLDTLEEYVGIGSIEQMEALKASKTENESAIFAEEFKCSEEIAASLLIKMTRDEAAAIVTLMPTRDKVSESYRPMAKNPTADVPESDKSSSLARSLV